MTPVYTCWEKNLSVQKQNVNTPKDYYKNSDLAQDRKRECFKSCKITFFCNLLILLGITSQTN